jgi:dTDP-4-amino-4,6-dideoxygalactose transaminase
MSGPPNDRPLVSVIIPTYHRPVLLAERSILSVLRQTYTNWELIVVDDGSPDDEAERVVERFGDRRIRYVRKPPFDGSQLSDLARWHVAGAEARNYGLELVRGDVIAPLDDDDAFTPEHLAECVDLIARGDADFVYGTVLVRDLETGAEHQDLFAWDDPASRALFEQRNILYHSSVCYAARFASYRYPLDGRHPGDYTLWRAILRAGGRFASLPTPQAVYYGGGTTGAIHTWRPAPLLRDAIEGPLATLGQAHGQPTDASWSERLVTALSQREGVVGALASSSRSAALDAAVTAAARLTGDRREVILPSYAPHAVADSVRRAGLVAVLADVDGPSLCISAATAAPLLSARTAAVLAVNSHGNSCDLAPLRERARANGSLLLCYSSGELAIPTARVPDELADVEVTCYRSADARLVGDTAMVSWTDPSIEAELRRGMYGGPGELNPPSELAAAVACARLPWVDSWEEERRRAAGQYRVALASAPGVETQTGTRARSPRGWQDFVIVLPNGADVEWLSERLRFYRIESSRCRTPLHWLPEFASCDRSSLAATDDLAERTLRLPLYAHIRPQVVSLVASAVKASMRGRIRSREGSLGD